MEWILPIAGIIAAVAFLILVIGIVVVLLSVDRVTNSITHNISQNEDKISQVVQWSNVAMEVADKWQNRRNRRDSANYKTSSVANDTNHSYTTRVDNK